MRILKPEIVEPSAWQPTDALTHISPTKDSQQQQQQQQGEGEEEAEGEQQQRV